MVIPIHDDLPMNAGGGWDFNSKLGNPNKIFKPMFYNSISFLVFLFYFGFLGAGNVSLSLPPCIS